MASNAMTSAGTTLSICPTLPANYDAAGFGAVGMTYTLVGEITDLGEFGKEYNLITHNPLGDRKTYKLKGSYNNGSIQASMALDENDAGQTAMRTAQDSDSAVTFKVTLQDGTLKYFTGMVMGFRVSVGGVDAITSATSTIEIDSDIVTVTA